jgi:LDH2 family malate/lactate/ureidoglycolate dehydrogenase
MATTTEKDIIWVPFDTMEKFMVDVFKGIGVPEEDARISAEVLITADKRGIDSHGVARMKTIYYDRIKQGIQNPVTQFEVVREGKTTAVVDGHDGMGHTIAKRSMQMAIDKAKAHGMGMTAVRNSTHYGIAGYYVMMAAEDGMIGITGTNARPSVAPTFGVENMMGTNPLTIGLPTDDPFPFVIDCATSLTQRGKVEVYARIGKDLPRGWAIGLDGTAKTDSKAILTELVKGTAALTPLGGIGEELGGHKGYGYCAAIEILSAALQGGSYMKQLLGVKDGKKVPYHLGHFFIAIDIKEFCPVDQFKKTAGDILRELRASKKAPGEKRIYTAGEKEHLCGQERAKKGVPLNDENRKEILAMRDELGLQSKYKFPF